MVHFGVFYFFKKNLFDLLFLVVQPRKFQLFKCEMVHFGVFYLLILFLYDLLFIGVPPKKSAFLVRNGAFW